MCNRLREFIEKFYPTEPIRLSFSRLKIFFIILLLSVVVAFFYLRSINKNELELLKEKHQEIQLTVQNYLNSMTKVNYDENRINEVRNKLNNYKNELLEIEERISSIRKFWFLE